MNVRLGKLGKPSSPRRGRFVAADFDERRLRAVVAEHVPRGTRILRTAIESFPDGLDTGQPAEIGRFLAEMLEKHRMRGVGLIMSLPRSKVVLKPLTLPPLADEHELAAMVQFQVSKELAFSAAEAVIDYAIETHYGTAAEDDASEGVEVLVAAAKQEVVAFYQQVAVASGARLLRLGLRPYADVRALSRAGLNQDVDSLALVHVTHGETEVDVLAGHSLTFSRSALIRVSGGEGHGDPADAITLEAARSLQSYHAVQRGRRIDRVMVAGDTGVEQQVAGKLSDRLHVPCDLFDPVEAMRLKKAEHESPSALISAIGLAVADGDARQLPFDFLNPKRPKPRRDMRKVRRTALISAAVLLVALGVAWGVRQRTDRANQIESLKTLLREQKESNKPRAALIKRVKSLRQWQDDAHRWVDHWALLSGLFPPPDKAYIEGFSAIPGSVDLDNGRKKAAADIRFTLRAQSSAVFMQLAQRLRDAGYIVETTKSSSDEAGALGYSYSISVVLKRPAGRDMTLDGLTPVPRRRDDLFHPANESAVEEYFDQSRRASAGDRRTNRRRSP